MSKELFNAWLVGLGVMVLGIVSLIAILIALSKPMEAGELRCPHFKEGYTDGYCVEQRYVCYGPLSYPACFEYDYGSIREAYHAGFRRGELKYRQESGRL